MKLFFTGLKRFVLGLCMVWLTEVLCVSLVDQYAILNEREILWWFLGGLLCGCLLFSKVRPVFLYVLGHELTHWLLAKLFFRKTSKFTLRMNSGSVRVAEPNIWIILGPYILPFYMLVGLLVVLLLDSCLSFERVEYMVFSVVIGVLYANHIVMTLVALQNNQPDLKFNGPLYSTVFILFFNVLFLYLGLMVCGGKLESCWQVPHRIFMEQIGVLKRLIWWNSLVV